MPIKRNESSMILGIEILKSCIWHETIWCYRNNVKMFFIKHAIQACLICLIYYIAGIIIKLCKLNIKRIKLKTIISFFY